MIANIAPADALICLTPQFSQIEFSGTAADSEENNNQQFCLTIRSTQRLERRLGDSGHDEERDRRRRDEITNNTNPQIE